jgi:hypothetical protein
MTTDDKTPVDPPSHDMFATRSEREELGDILGNVLDVKLRPLAEELTHLRAAVAHVTDRLGELEKRQTAIERRPATNGPLVWAAFAFAVFNTGALAWAALAVANWVH